MDRFSHHGLWHAEMDRLAIDQALPERSTSVRGRTGVSFAQIVASAVSVASLSLGALGELLAVSGETAGQAHTVGMSPSTNLLELVVGIVGIGLANQSARARSFLITAGGVYLALGLVEMFTSDAGSPMTAQIESAIGLSELGLYPMIGPLLYMWLGTMLAVIGFVARTRAQINARFGHEQV